MTTVLLASSSPRRTELLRRAGLPHTVVAPAEDVIPPRSLSADDAVGLIARAKAEDVVGQAPAGSFVIGADTMVVGPGGPLGKPHTAQRARRMLAELRGRRHVVLTGVCVLTPGGIEASGVSRSQVTMRNFSDREIDAYVDGGEPLDRAGAYAVQGGGGELIEVVQGRLDTVVGLDVAMTFDLLSRCGYGERLARPDDLTIPLRGTGQMVRSGERPGTPI
ncbi:MAG: nucleoside triphosphate pyrophosphatase [Candidatus Dormibacteria bacterium]